MAGPLSLTSRTAAATLLTASVSPAMKQKLIFTPDVQPTQFVKAMNDLVPTVYS